MSDIYKRKLYLKKIRGFYNDTMIKVITGIRRYGKSFLLKSITKELESVIDSKVKDNDFKYLFIDEVQNVENFEPLINSYREEGNYSIFLTGSNSYLLSGELVSKLTRRYVEIEMLPLNFYEYIDMKKFLKKNIDTNIYHEFEKFIRNGDFLVVYIMIIIMIDYFILKV